MRGGFPAVLIYEDLEHLSPYMHTVDDVVGKSLNSPALLEANARLAAAAVLTLAGPIDEPAPAEFLRGDGNADQAVDLTDVIFILNYLFASKLTPTCLDAADANDDGELDISDPVRILVHLYNTSYLPEPSGACGPDPTGDDLGCQGYLPCNPD